MLMVQKLEKDEEERKLDDAVQTRHDGRRLLRHVTKEDSVFEQPMEGTELVQAKAKVKWGGRR